MAFRFQRRIKLAPGIRLNIGKRGASVSVGRRGLSRTVRPGGGSTTNVGIPGTGMSWRTKPSKRRPKK